MYYLPSSSTGPGVAGTCRPPGDLEPLALGKGVNWGREKFTVPSGQHVFSRHSENRAFLWKKVMEK